MSCCINPKSSKPQDLQVKDSFTKINGTIQTLNDLKIVCQLINKQNSNSVIFVGGTNVVSLIEGQTQKLKKFCLWILTKSKHQNDIDLQDQIKIVPNLYTQLQKYVQSLSKLLPQDIKNSLGEMIKLKYPNYHRQLFIWEKGKMEITEIYGQVRAMAKFVSNDAADYGADILVILT